MKWYPVDICVVGFRCKTCGGTRIQATEGWEWFRCRRCPPKWGRPEEFEDTLVKAKKNRAKT